MRAPILQSTLFLCGGIFAVLLFFFLPEHPTVWLLLTKSFCFWGFRPQTPYRGFTPGLPSPEPLTPSPSHILNTPLGVVLKSIGYGLSAVPTGCADQWSPPKRDFAAQA